MVAIYITNLANQPTEHYNMEHIRYLTDTNRYLIDKLQNTLFIDEIHIVYTN